MSEPETEPTEPDAAPDAEPTPDEPGPSDDEAAEAEEAEQADEEAVEPETQDEPTPSAEPETPTDRKTMQAAQRAVQTYAKKIGELFGEQANELLPCPLCGDTVWPGFVHIGDAGRMPNEVKAATMAFLGYAAERDYPAVPDFQTCPACQGEGKVSTGSHVAGKTSRDCPRCAGNGYIGAPMESPNGAAVEHPQLTGPTAIPSGAGVPDTDPSGEPRLLPDGRENPNYGKWPQYKVPIEPWGQTAGLTVQDAVS